MSHTPGPWRYIQSHSEYGRAIVQRGNEGGFVVQGTSKDREDADAALIAAAPDLLAALDNLLITWENDGKKPGWCKRFSAAKKQARAAIKKAKGL